jgi:hypothetical protein
VAGEASFPVEQYVTAGEIYRQRKEKRHCFCRYLRELYNYIIILQPGSLLRLFVEREHLLGVQHGESLPLPLHQLCVKQSANILHSYRNVSKRCIGS